MPYRDLPDYLSYLLASAHRQMRAGLSSSIAEAVGDDDFTEEHWRILHVLADEQGRSMGELAELVLLNGPALTKNIDKLVTRGAVQRAADGHDSRKVLVFISDLGLELVARLKARIDAHHVDLEAALGTRRAQQLKKLLEDFIVQAQAGSRAG